MFKLIVDDAFDGTMGVLVKEMALWEYGNNRQGTVVYRTDTMLT